MCGNLAAYMLRFHWRKAKKKNLALLITLIMQSEVFVMAKSEIK